MKKLLAALLLVASVASAKVNVKDGKFWFNDVRQEMVWGRSCFKLGNPVVHHFRGQGGGPHTLGSAETFVRFHMENQPFEFLGETVQPLGMPDGFVCRVFLENAAWEPCDSDNNGVPNNCMFGSEPRDIGFWNGSGWNQSEGQTNRNQFRDNARLQVIEPVAAKTIEWFYQMSEKYNMAFELVIDATLKHDNIPKGEIDHIIRVVAAFMGEEMEPKYPKALVFSTYRNEWNAHNQSGHTLADVNMWAVRTHRDNYFPHNRTPIFVDGGGANSFEYDVGPEDGHYSGGIIHPERGSGWQTFPNDVDMRQLRRDARGMIVGANESMYYISANGRNGTPNTLSWYRPGGSTADFTDFKQFLDWQLDVNAVRDGYDWFNVHDDKGAASIWNWPRAMTEVDQWLANNIGVGVVDPPPVDPPDPPGPTMIYYDVLITFGFETVLERGPGQEGLDVYNPWFRECYADANRQCMNPFLDVLARSTEFKNKNTR